jgi:hypothetical protein
MEQYEKTMGKYNEKNPSNVSLKKILEFHGKFHGIVHELTERFSPGTGHHEQIMTSTFCGFVFLAFVFVLVLPG